MNFVTRRDFLTLAGRLALASAALPTSAAGSKMVLVRDGVAHGAIQVEPGSPVACEYGAQELQYFLKEMSGATLPIFGVKNGQQAPTSLTKPLVTIGNGPFAEEEYRIQSVGNRLEIRGGGKRGALYGCYALLEDVLGCRWYTRTIQKIPHRPTIVIGAMNLRDRPGFEYREPYFGEALEQNWAVRNRTNGTKQHLAPSVGGHVVYGQWVHTFNAILPPEQYFDAHPEYFSLIGGKRLKTNTQLCLTNSDVLRLTIEKVQQWIHDNPDANIFSVSQNDNNHNCQCDNCKAVERSEGAASGVLLRFVNAVADAIVRDHPTVLIDTLAYQWSEDPPRHVRPRPNVRVRLAPIGACIGHALDGCTENAHVYRNLRAWAALTQHLYLWHYSTNFANYLQPMPDLAEISADIPLLHRNGVVGLFSEGDYAPNGGGAMSELKAYLMAKLMWNPNRPAGPIVSDFLQGVYGMGAPFVHQWLDLLQSGLRQPGVHAHIYDPPTAPYLSDAVLGKGVSLFDSAEAACHSDPVALDQVQRARLALEYVQLERAAPASASRADLARRVADKVQKYGITQVREGEPAAKYLARVEAPLK